MRVWKDDDTHYAKRHHDSCQKTPVPKELALIYLSGTAGYEKLARQYGVPGTFLRKRVQYGIGILLEDDPDFPLPENVNPEKVLRNKERHDAWKEKEGDDTEEYLVDGPRCANCGILLSTKVAQPISGDYCGPCAELAPNYWNQAPGIPVKSLCGPGWW